MTDKREQILARLVLIADGVPGVAEAGRNQTDLTDRQLPAVMVLEGDEQPSPAVVEGRNLPPTAPIRMVMTPELCIIGGDKPSDLGTVLNTLRAGLIKAVTTDSALIAILGANGAIAYRGLVSDLALGRSMMGRMALRFDITYVVKPTDL